MTDTFFMVRYRTNMYLWGRGWLSNRQAELWDAYLKRYAESGEHYPWGIIMPRNRWSCAQLYSVYSIVYLHPMSGLVRLHDEKEVDAFKEFMLVLCNYCMGEVEFKVQEVSFNLEV